MNGLQRAGRLIGAFLTGAMCLVLVGIGILQTRDMHALDDHGVTIDVPIMDNLTTKGAKGGVSYEIIYAFNAPAQPQPIYVFHRQRVTKEAYEQLKVGQAIRVQYLPENPHITRMLTPGSEDQNLNIVLVMLLLAGMSAGLLYAARTGKGIFA
jgi:hypothetical protein